MRDDHETYMLIESLRPGQPDVMVNVVPRGTLTERLEAVLATWDVIQGAYTTSRN